jgi:hypothetical protein
MTFFTVNQIFNDTYADDKTFSKKIDIPSNPRIKEDDISLAVVISVNQKISA